MLAFFPYKNKITIISVQHQQLFPSELYVV